MHRRADFGKRIWDLRISNRNSLQWEEMKIILQQLFLGTERASGFCQPAIMMRDGDLKLQTDLSRSCRAGLTNWIASMNLNTSLPNKLFLFNATDKNIPGCGTMPEAWGERQYYQQVSLCQDCNCPFWKTYYYLIYWIFYSKEFKDQLKTVPRKHFYQANFLFYRPAEDQFSGAQDWQHNYTNHERPSIRYVSRSEIDVQAWIVASAMQGMVWFMPILLPTGCRNTGMRLYWMITRPSCRLPGTGKQVFIIYINRPLPHPLAFLEMK